MFAALGWFWAGIATIIASKLYLQRSTRDDEGSQGTVTTGELQTGAKRESGDPSP